MASHGLSWPLMASHAVYLDREKTFYCSYVDTWLWDSTVIALYLTSHVASYRELMYTRMLQDFRAC
jgi:hypothetical protein